MGRREQRGAPERVALIGLGRFGTRAAPTWHDLGFDVTAIDRGEKQVAEAAAYITLAAQGDGTDEDLLRSLAVDRSHVEVVTQSESQEASVLATLVLKRLGVPWVSANATSALHTEVPRLIVADKVVVPAREEGVRLDHSSSVRYIPNHIPLHRHH